MGNNEENTGKSAIFREKSLQRIASPEELNDYLKVTTPAVWMILGAVIAMLAGIIIWSLLSNLNTTVSGDATAKGGYITVLVTEDGAEHVREGQTIIVGSNESKVGEVFKDDFGRTSVGASMDVPDGEYRARIVVEQITPFELLFD
ncbi:MAG: hypothetical protein K6E91_06700 [Butyrivibrio sp.]|nr:hypothetical protein [Butyrivibrio sp.]